MNHSFAKLAAMFLCSVAIGAAPTLAQRPVQAMPQQRPSAPPPLPTDNMAHAYGGYMVGTGDLLNIRVADEDDVTGRYQVNPNGDVELPLLKKPIHASGLSTFDLSKSIEAELKKQDILKDPSVTVFIERGMSQTVTILGQVSRPGTYPIEQRTTLVDAISLAGGLTPMAGQYATVDEHSEQTSQRPANPGSSESVQPDSLQTTERLISIDLPELMSGARPTANVLLHAGDVITISDAGTVYIVGAVMKPGAFYIQDQKNGITATKAMALVEGPQPTASLGRAIIVRNSASTKDRQEIPVELDKAMKGQVADPVLEANDILYVPQSGFKKGMHRLGDVAVLAAGEIVGYGIGLRIAK